MSNKKRSMREIGEYISNLQKAEAEVKRLRRIILVNNLWQEAPCCLCGCNGEGYFDSSYHACVLEAAEIQDVKEMEEDKK